ncbi:MAG: 3-methyl-2-oxobutanoate hydroxymethyltransferase [Pelagibacteraceae bacterium]|nr:3-methyl-2-oxobutanoate hydroxymethyltransferase [Pelagibacteraceae bacterium]PHX89431.1 MAG: 3-methyl-2-oxobutanoate hydroxymethyltransferase [Pelagibacteraceae bacterium]
MNKIQKIQKKKYKSKIVCLTAYSKNVAEEIDKYTDLILVGDSLGSVLYNYNTTRNVTLKMMIEHGKSVRQGVTKSLMVVDLPYNTYRNKIEALKNSKKIIKETKCDAVKLEGGLKIIKIIKHLTKHKIAVMGHVGILPQSVKKKFRFKGKNPKEHKQILADAIALEEAGVFSVVIEGVEKNLSKLITNKIKIPTIGIGASNHCDGQILVTDDILGLTKSKIKFVKEYFDMKKNIRLAAKKYKLDVINKKFPNKKHLY